MGMDLIARISKVLPVQSGQSAKGTWTKNQILVETQDAYPKSIQFDDFNNKAGSDKFSEGDMVKISFNLESRENNGRYYTSASIWKIEAHNGEAAPAGKPAAAPPRAQPTPARNPMPAPDFSSSPDDDSQLPF